MPTNPSPRSRRLPLDPFLLGLVGAVVLAFLLPGPGAENGPLHPELLTRTGIALIFFLNGLTLSFSALRAGALSWRLHLLVQASTYLLFPLCGAIFYLVPPAWMSPGLKLGFLFLCALPSTVSSSVAFTALAGGNVPGAIFNATLSNLLAIFATPLLVGLSAGIASTALPLGQILRELVAWLAVPLVAGQFLRPVLGRWAQGHPRFVRAIDRATILLIVYVSFCDSVAQGVWKGDSWRLLLTTLLGTALLFSVVFFCVRTLCELCRLSRADRIAGVFCGSKKSLATGIPMAQLMFAHQPVLSLVILPTLIYHPLQIFICAGLAAHWAPK